MQLGRATGRVNWFTFSGSLSPGPGILSSQSQTGRRLGNRVAAMGVKYYTHFVLTGDPDEASDQEFSGVVELNRPTEPSCETKEIEALLARKLDLKSGAVRLINWARLQ
jgi:hypothetical protein